MVILKMLRTQFDDLNSKLGHSHYGTVPSHLQIDLYITTGKHKGKVGRLIEVKVGQLTVQVGTEKPVTFLYTKLERVDDNGNPIWQNSLDTTGRPVSEGQVVCYSQSAGNNSHALEIGRIIKTNPSGTLVIKPMIHNGERIQNSYYNRERKNVRADRVMILPIDNTLVTTWVLSEFDVYKADALLGD